MRSDNVTKGSERAPNRSLFYALGYTPEELERMAAFFALLGEMLDAFALDAPGEGPVIDP